MFSVIKRFTPNLFLLSLVFLPSAVLAQESDRDKGIDLYRDSKFSEAIVLLEKSVASNPGDRPAWIYLGGAYIHIGETSKAAKAFAKSRVRPTAVVPTYDKSVKITHKPRATYTEAARRRGSSGTVQVAVEFRFDGKIGFAFPLPTSTDQDLVRQSVQASQGIRFEPAEKNGAPITVINLIEYSFHTY